MWENVDFLFFIFFYFILFFFCKWVVYEWKVGFGLKFRFKLKNDFIYFALDKTPEDKEHEGMLIDQWVTLTEERNAILCPSAGSGVPGATMDWYVMQK